MPSVHGLQILKAFQFRRTKARHCIIIISINDCLAHPVCEQQPGSAQGTINGCFAISDMQWCVYTKTDFHLASEENMKQ